MPNWCENKLTVTGNLEQLKAFEVKARKDVDLPDETALSFDNFLPTPKILLNLKAPNDVNPEQMLKLHGASDWYQWQIKNWGTKWDITAHLEKTEDELCYQFDSAWSPLTEFFVNVSREYPELVFELDFEEPGMGFAGNQVIENGEIMSDEERECTQYDEDGEEIIN